MPKSRVINDFIDRKMQSMFNNIDNAFGVQKYIAKRKSR